MPISAVLGANGYLGKHLVHYLIAAGHQVFAYDIQVDNFTESTHYQTLDIKQRENLDILPDKLDYVYYFSGITGTHAGFDNYRSYLEINEGGLLNLLDYLRHPPHPPRLIFPSTRLIFKGSSEPLFEESPYEAKTIYAANKIADEYFISAYHNAFDIPYNIFRICVPYGNIFDNNFSYGTIGFFTKMATNHQPITLYGDGQMRRTFTHVTDLCDQIISVASNPRTINQTFNTAGETWSLLDIAKLFANKYNIDVKQTPWPEKDLRIESGDTVFDDTKIRQFWNKDLLQLKDIL